MHYKVKSTGSRKRRSNARKSNVTTIVLLPKKRKTTSLARRRSAADRRRGAAQVKNDVKKVLKAAKSEPIPKDLQTRVESHIHALTKDQDADLQVFKAVAAFMFKDPQFATLIEQRYGIVLNKALRIYLRTVGIILEAVLGTWISVAGIFSIALSITKFILYVAWFACIMSVRLVDRLGFVPHWLSQRMTAAKKNSQKQVVLHVIT